MAAFATGLRQLRDHAGKPGYRQLAQRAHFSATALSEAAGGRKLPSLAVTMAFVEACGGDQADWKTRWQEATEALAQAEPAEADRPAAGRAPYRGLAAYEQADAEWYFGREPLVDEMVRRLTARRFLAVFGPSGCGKSSLLRAGLLRAASAGRLPGGESTACVLITPGARPLDNLALAFAALAGVPAGSLRTDLGTDPTHLRLAIRQAVDAQNRDGELLVVVDQFEEVFTLCDDTAERDAFIAALLAAQGDDSRARVVIAGRADVYTRCATCPDLVTALRDAQILVGSMTALELRAAITRPATRAGLTVEGALVSTIVAEATGRPGALPLVSHALLEAWRRRRGNAITLAGYEAAGGLAGAIAQTAERVYADLDGRGRAAVQAALLRLVEVGEDTEVSRRRAEWSEFHSEPAAVLRLLAGARLVTLGRSGVEIAHEALIHAWPRFGRWISEDRDGLRVQRQLSEATAIWLAHDRDGGSLYRGVRLLQATERARQHTGRLTTREREFLTASRAAEDRESAARRRRVRATVTALIAAVAVVSVLAAWALTQADRAQRERDTALSRQLAAQARSQLNVDPELAVLLAKQAVAVTYTRQADAVLRQAVAQSRLRAVLPGHDGPVYAVTFAGPGRLISGGEDGTVRIWASDRSTAPVVLPGHRGRVWGVAVSGDGQRLATGGADRTVRLWPDPATGESRVLGTHERTVRNVVFSPDGTRVASASDDGTVRVWDTTGGSDPVVLRGHDGPVLGVAFSPDGKLLASSGNDRTIRLWPVAGGAPTVLSGHEASVEYLVFSADGTRLASASTDGTARIWPIGGSGTPLVLRGHDGTVEAVAFAADGQVATMGNDRTVRLWNAGSVTHPRILRGHKGTVWAAAFSPDGQRLASASDDGTIRLWDATMTGVPLVMRGHTGSVWSGAYSADGHRIVTGGHDRTVRVWDTTTGREPVVLRGHRDEVTSVDLSPDGNRAVSASLDGEVRLWNWSGGDGQLVSTGHEGAVMQVAFHPDGRHILSGGADGTVRISSADGGEPIVLRGHHGAVRATFSPDGRLVASAGWDGSVRLWNWAAGGEPVVLRGHEGPVWAADFSPDGSLLATAGSDGTVRVWHLSHPDAPVNLGAHQGVAWTVAFSADGHLIVSSGSDGTVRIWQPDGASDPIVFDGHGASVEATSFDPSGDVLLTVHGDGTVRTWRCPVCGPITTVMAAADQQVTRQLTDDERRMFRIDA
ncbi:WD40 repeat domain-containing protein [Virgisporangium aurantiacum]|uniref:WD40 repeat domain-containing protein n=1 Tax=Virgisporangium aurantiacum TaxID=175570 RepID=UPI0019503807|nr:WD40 repeat domain-containing protein [Virgisporangium aurantiacum]